MPVSSSRRPGRATCVSTSSSASAWRRRNGCWKLVAGPAPSCRTWLTTAALHGLDLDPTRLADAARHVPQAKLVCGDALGLPYPAEVFEITFCHFLLLWVPDPLQALLEMRRVTRPGGYVLALAEPDYNSRVDKPDPLAPLGRWQAESLRRQGADPGLGARLAELFRQAGIPPIETGRLRRMKGPPLHLQKETWNGRCSKPTWRARSRRRRSSA